MTRPILVTGAAGYLGRVVVSKLLAKGAKVASIVRRPSKQDLDALECELSSDAAVDALFERIQPGAVVHAAAYIPAAASAGDPTRTLQDNIEATANIAAAAIKYGVSRLFYCSSIEAYGPIPIDGLLYREGDQLQPQSPYGISKACGEQAIRIAGLSGVETRILRFPGLHGGERKSGIVASLINAAKTKTPIQIAEPDTTLALAFVDDAADVIADAATEKMGISGSIINVANGNITLSSMTSLVASRSGSEDVAKFGNAAARNRGMALEILSKNISKPLPSIEQRIADLIADAFNA